MLEIGRAVIEVYFSFGWALGLVMFGRLSADDDYCSAGVTAAVIMVLWPIFVANAIRKSRPEIQDKDEGL